MKRRIIGLFMLSCCAGCVSTQKTPLPTYSPSYKAVYFECRAHDVLHIDLDEIRPLVANRLAWIEEQADGDTHELLRLLGTNSPSHLVETESYTVDLPYVLIRQMVLRSNPGVQGWRLDEESGKSHYLHEITQTTTQIVRAVFIVRPSGVDTFLEAFHLAREQGVDTEHSSIASNDLIRFTTSWDEAPWTVSRRTEDPDL